MERGRQNECRTYCNGLCCCNYDGLYYISRSERSDFKMIGVNQATIGFVLFMIGFFLGIWLLIKSEWQEYNRSYNSG